MDAAELVGGRGEALGGGEGDAEQGGALLATLPKVRRRPLRHVVNRQPRAAHRRHKRALLAARRDGERRRLCAEEGAQLGGPRPLEAAEGAARVLLRPERLVPLLGCRGERPVPAAAVAAAAPCGELLGALGAALRHAERGGVGPAPVCEPLRVARRPGGRGLALGAGEHKGGRRRRRVQRHCEDGAAHAKGAQDGGVVEIPQQNPAVQAGRQPLEDVGGHV
mmetsp:Transcript_372/g.1249  ORF Transcript_372/g.1249 Transcript_372/m.1249 type:complete len:222 (+) Transcript_372:1458-2123(+)